MPVKLLPRFCIFNPCLPVSRLSSVMKLSTSAQATRVLPIFSQVFPFKLKYTGFRSSVVHNVQQFGVRRISSRPRTGSSSGFVRSRGRGEFQASKSLIEDEAELSDWVSELRTDSFRGRMTSEDDDSGRDRGASRSRSKVVDNGRDSFSTKRRRENDNADDELNPRRKSGGTRGGNANSFMERRGVKDNRIGEGSRSGGKDFSSGYGRDGGVGGRSRGRGRDSGSGYGRDGGAGGRGRSGTKDLGSGYGRDGGLGGHARTGGNNFSSGRGGRGGGTSLGYGRGGGAGDGLRRGSKLGSQFGRERGTSEGSWRDDKDIGSQYGRDRGTAGGLKRGGKVPRREALLDEDDSDNDSDDDEEESEMVQGGFGDLLSEEDSEVDHDEDDDTDVMKKSSCSLLGVEKEVRPKVSPSSPGQSDSYLSETRFDQCSISALTLKGIKDAGYEKMTVVQEATLPVILKGKDVLAKARTGTGKTVAFLLPAIEVIAKSPPESRDQRRPPILVLVICPTRELASQAAAEANRLLKYHPSVGVQVVIGGTRLALEQKRMQANPCQILVATPGRLRDHTENTAGFATRLMGVKVLVLDEADHLLDMGFRKDIEKIIAAVPKQRQTLLFSATVPEEVRQICHIALKRDHEYINTVEEGSEETHTQVRQTHLIAPLDKHFPMLYVLLKEHISDDVDYKVLVFCTTAMVTRLVANLLAELNLNVREIHSRKPQSYRTRVSDEFRKSKGLILVTSDVSARGVDYPDVTLVIQVGLPADREQYIHRLGRTGRKGKEGQGILVLAPWEEYFLGTIKDLPTSKAPEPLIDPDTKKKVERALSQVEMKNKEAAYQAWLGYYNSVKNVGRDKHRLVELANDFSRSMGLDNPPAIPKQVLGKMGLRNVPGLRSK